MVKDGHIEIPERMRAFFLAKKDVDERIEQLLGAFDRQFAARQQLVNRFAFLSPAILLNEAMNSVAGNGSRRYLAFKTQVESFHNEWRKYFYPRIFNGRAMMPADFEALPRWHWTDVHPAETSKDAWRRTALMLVLAIGFAAIALARSRRYSVA
jgi:ABC-2 type transport system permease protein